MPRRASRSTGGGARLAFFALACAALTGGCTYNAAAPRNDPSVVLAAARRHGVVVDDPLDLDSGIIDEVEQALGGRGEPIERLKRLDEYLKGSGDRAFRYAHGTHLDAREAYAQRRGDCLSYALLFGSLSRALGIRTYFVHASEVGLRYERAGHFFTSSHVAVGYGTGPRPVVIDFSIGRVSDWHLTPYEPISDATLVALHYNNLAVAQMNGQHIDDAERLFEALLEVETSVPEIYNNYGVLLKRRGRHEESLAVLTRGMKKFPHYSPFYTNGIHAAYAAGQPTLAATLEERGRTFADRDPFFLFARGMFLYKKRSFGYAAEQFARARGAQPDSPVILAWLTRAYAEAGDRERAREAFTEARRLAPAGTLVRDLSLQYPDLLQ